MNTRKSRITITIDPEMLNAVDVVADARGESRSAVIERMLMNGLVDERSRLRLMENPITRRVFDAFVSAPGLLESIAVLVADRLTPEQVAEMKTGVRTQGQRRCQDGS